MAKPQTYPDPAGLVGYTGCQNKEVRRLSSIGCVTPLAKLASLAEKINKTRDRKLGAAS